jgi:hypothetical protein
MNKWVFIVAVLFLTETGFSQTARTYYDEIYNAGGLDRMADQYVCFDDDPTLNTFFIFAKSDTLKAFLESAGGYAKLSAKEKAQLTKGFLTVRGYDKGVPLSGEDNYIKDGESWTTEVGYINKQSPVRMRFEISWQTLRYKRSAEILKSDLTLQSTVARYGRCELVAPTVRQKAD